MSEKYDSFTVESQRSPTSPDEEKDHIGLVLNKHKEDLEKVLGDAKTARKAIIQKMRESPYSKGNETHFMANSALYKQIDSTIRHMMQHMEDVNHRLDKHGVNVALGSSDHFLGHYSISEWSNEVKEQTQDLCALVTQISGVGAAITYTTLFSAIRGSVALMSWAFVLFLMGLTLPMGSQVLLSWAAGMPSKTKFPPVMLKWWRFIVTCSILCGITGTIGAVFVLLLSMYKLQYSPVASGESADLVFTKSPRYAFWLAIACISVGCLHIIKVHILFIWDNCDSRERLSQIYLIGDEHKDSADDDISRNIEMQHTLGNRSLKFILWMAL